MTYNSPSYMVSLNNIHALQVIRYNCRSADSIALKNKRKGKDDEANKRGI